MPCHTTLRAGRVKRRCVAGMISSLLLAVAVFATSVVAIAAATPHRHRSGATAAEVLFITEAVKIQRHDGAATRSDGSCPCSGHPTRSFCPLNSTPGQCDKSTRPPCKLGGHCARPPQYGPGSLPVSVTNPSVVVTPNGTVVLFIQAEVMTYKSQQRLFSRIYMVTSDDRGQSWSTNFEMGPAVPQALYAPSSNTLFLVSKSPNFLDNGSRPEPQRQQNFMSKSARPGDPTAWTPATPVTVRAPDGTRMGHCGDGYRTHGIELQRGPHRGRLIFPRFGYESQCSFNTTTTMRTRTKRQKPPLHPYAIFSDDHGATFRKGEELSSKNLDLVWDENTLTEMANGSVLMSVRIDDAKNADRKHPDPDAMRRGTSRGFARSDDGGATWAQRWTLWERQPQIPDSPCSDALIYSNKTGAMYWGHPGEWSDPATGPTPDKGLRANYTILRSLDQGATWQFLEVVFAAGSGYSDMHLLPSSTADTGDLIGVAFQMSTSARSLHMSMGWAVVRVPAPPKHKGGNV